MPRRRHPIRTPFKRAVGRSKARVLRKADPGTRRVVTTVRKARKVKWWTRRLL
ncbi:hypothetical protein [Glycomyces sp. NPDC047010]|uniref:hypothetical protein n=1 Tax=Glycomyces sp. NPDC047010 TaxID=3155023 RepID=UPI0033D7BAD7